MSTAGGGWPDAVIRAVQQLPSELRWHVQVGIVQALKPTVCRRCSGTEFRIASQTTVICIACMTITGADVEGCPHPGFIDLGYERHRVRLVVRPLDWNRPRTLTVTQWRSELAAGLWGNPRLIQEGVSKTLPRLLELEPTLDPDDFATRLVRLTALTQVRHGPSIVYVAGGGCSRVTRTWELEDKVKEALLRALGCHQGDRWIWYRPGGAVVFDRDRDRAAWLARLDAQEAVRRRHPKIDRGIVPTELTTVSYESEARAWIRARQAARTVFPRFLAALRVAFAAKSRDWIRGVAVNGFRHSGVTATLSTMRRRRDISPEAMTLFDGIFGDLRVVRDVRVKYEPKVDRFVAYQLPFRSRVKRLRGKRRTYAIHCEARRVERMYDYLLDPATERR